MLISNTLLIIYSLLGIFKFLYSMLSISLICTVAVYFNEVAELLYDNRTWFKVFVPRLTKHLIVTYLRGCLFTPYA